MLIVYVVAPAGVPRETRRFNPNILRNIYNMAITATSTVEMVRGKYPQAVVETVDFRNEQTIVLLPEHLLTVCAYLQKNLKYDFLSSVTAVDWLKPVPSHCSGY